MYIGRLAGASLLVTISMNLTVMSFTSSMPALSALGSLFLVMGITVILLPADKDES